MKKTEKYIDEEKAGYLNYDELSSKVDVRDMILGYVECAASSLLERGLEGEAAFFPFGCNFL